MFGETIQVGDTWGSKHHVEKQKQKPRVNPFLVSRRVKPYAKDFL